MTTTEKTQSEADSHYAYFAERVQPLITSIDLNDEMVDAAHDELNDWPLDVSLWAIDPRSGACEWEILLGTGGPATHVIVHTDMDGIVENAVYEYQNWFTPWTRPSHQDYGLVTRFAEQFYFGEVHLTVDGVDV